jgi:hypothetical protein
MRAFLVVLVNSLQVLECWMKKIALCVKLDNTALVLVLECLTMSFNACPADQDNTSQERVWIQKITVRCAGQDIFRQVQECRLQAVALRVCQDSFSLALVWQPIVPVFTALLGNLAELSEVLIAPIVVLVHIKQGQVWRGRIPACCVKEGYTRQAWEWDTLPIAVYARQESFKQGWALNPRAVALCAVVASMPQDSEVLMKVNAWPVDQESTCQGSAWWGKQIVLLATLVNIRQVGN